MNVSAKNPSKDENETLTKVLATMPEKGQQVVRALWNGHTQLEVSRMTNLPQTAVNYYKTIFQTRAAEAMGIAWV